MALRLAGEQLGVLRGMDSAGWLREVTTSDALAGLKVNQLGTGRIVDFQDGGASKLHVLDGGRVAVADSIEIGGAPATLGAVRLANNAGMFGRNAAGSADIPLVLLSAGNIVEVANDGSSGLRLGNAGQIATVLMPALGMVPLSDATAPLGGASLRWTNGFFSGAVVAGTNPAATGTWRGPNGGTLMGRNAANTADLPLVTLSASNIVELGNDAGSGIRLGHNGQIAARLLPATGLLPLNDGEAPLGGTASRWIRGVFSESLQVGTTPAITGAIRLANNAGVFGRNAGNSTDLPLVTLDISNIVRLGDDGSSGLRLGNNGQIAAVLAPATGLVPLNDAQAPLGGAAKRWTSIFIGTGISNATVQLISATQGLSVADASGGATIDAEARTAINALLARIRAHGLIAT